jgi:alpha-L-rhamnosidase
MLKRPSGKRNPIFLIPFYVRITGLLFLLLSINSQAQMLLKPAERWTKGKWDARWIAPEGTSAYGVYYFRKSFELEDKPRQFIINISADNRYRLYINGQYVNDGPQLSDPRHWKFESLDISEFLHAGKNVAAVEVWNQGGDAPVYMMGKRLALIVQGDNEEAAVVNTNKTWKYYEEKGIVPITYKRSQPELSNSYYAAGPTDQILPSLAWDWETSDFDDSKWKESNELENGMPFLTADYGDAQWELSSRTIPLMDHKYQSFASVRRYSGLPGPIKHVDSVFVIPANQTVSILLDQGKMTTAFPELIVSGGTGSSIKITYAEAVFDDIHKIGNRDSIKGKTIHGIYDLFQTDGKPKRKFTTLSYRAFRYVQLDITTAKEPLTVDKLGSWFTAYPFQKSASFAASDFTLAKVFDVGWHTARLCAYETYMDCPYWERLQYIGDTRIQALISYYLTGDDRLARNALSQFEWSLQYDGLTYSRYPSSLPQYIPNYSLVWVIMINDFLMYRNDPDFVKTMLPGMEKVLDHFKRYVTTENLMTQQPYWDFIDHSYNTKKVLEASHFKRLTTNTLFYALALSRAAEVFGFFGQDAKSHEYFVLSQQLKEGVKQKCFDNNSGLYADTPDKNSFSVHSNVLAVLCGMMPKEEQAPLLKKVISTKNITPTTLYFDFYLARAMNQAGAGDLYYELLSKWKDLLKLGVTTFPEGVARSECHAWSASPDFEMLATFAGIQPQMPGFKKVIIRPLLQKLDWVRGSIPHWAGILDVSLDRKGKQLIGSVTLPPGITGRLEWGQSVLELKSGENSILLEDK